MAWRAWKGSIPAFTASPAHRGRYCWGITGASVMMLTWTPARASTPGVSKVLFTSSILLALVRVGPTAAGKPERATISGIRWPSVQCSRVILTPNSLATRMAVQMSSARWAWAFRGISPLSTGIRASSFMSKAGRFRGSSPAASFRAR